MRKTITLLSTTAMAAILLTGCSTSGEDNPPFRASDTQSRSTSSLLDYYQWLTRTDGETLRDARESAHRTAVSTPQEKIRRAWLISFHDNAPSDDLQIATQLLDEALNAPDLPEHQADLARFWRDMVTLRLQLRETMERLATANASLRQHNEQYVTTIESLRQRNDESTRQIEALTTIEQRLNRREQSGDGA